MSTEAAQRRSWLAVAVGLPALVVFLANACFIHNHFFIYPYLFDSGWFADIIWHQGIMPKNAGPVAGGIPYYWGWHVSPLISIASVLSYAFPGDRVAWYELFQGAIYTPLAFAPALLVAGEQRKSLLSAAIAALATLVFAFGGQVLACIGYPHFEILVPAGVCLMLGGIAADRRRITIVGLVLAIVTREDGGLHAGMLLLAVIVANRTKRPFPIAWRRLLILTAIAFGSSFAMMFVQRTFFVGPKHLELYLIGTPPFGHINGAVLVERFRVFREQCAIVWAPMLATIAIAVARRDPRYLLGWLVQVPWLALNFLAKQELKSSFSIYTGFPFVACAFWVGAYAFVADRKVWKLADRWPLVAVAVVSLAATFGTRSDYPASFAGLLDFMAWPKSKNDADVRAFVRDLREGKHGRVIVDGPLTAWTIEMEPPLPMMMGVDRKKPIASHQGDGLAFFALSIGRENVIDVMLHSPFHSCGRLAESEVYFCGRADRPLPSGFKPWSPILGSMGITRDKARREGASYIIEATAEPLLQLHGPYVVLRKGRYLVRWNVQLDRMCSRGSPEAPLMRVDVGVPRQAPVATLDVLAIEDRVELPFEVTSENEAAAWELRVHSGRCEAVLKGIDVTPLNAN